MRLWREGTQKQYSVYLWKWDEFCVQRQINLVQASVYEVSCMICSLKVCPIRPSILHAQRYLIISWAKIYPIANFQSSVTHLLNATWRVMYALDKLTLKVLSFKLVVLLAITSGQHCQTLTNLDIHEENGEVLFISVQESYKAESAWTHIHLFLCSWILWAGAVYIHNAEKLPRVYTAC